MKAALMAGCMAWALTAVAGPARSQNVPSFKPNVVEKSRTAGRITGPQTAAGVQDETELVASLNGIVIVNSPKAVRRGGTSTQGVEVRGEAEAVPAGVVSAASGFLGKPVSLASLNRLTRAMVLAYRRAGMPVVNVVVPAQDISNGTVQIVAVVARQGTVKLEGEVRNPDFYSDNWTTANGEFLTDMKVQEDLRYMNRKFWRRVDAIYAPGSKFSETDITLRAYEDKPWSVFAGADNTGTRTVGKYRFFAGFQVGDLWGLDHEFAYQVTTSDKFVDNLHAHVWTYSLPVYFWRTDLQLLGAFVQSEGNVGALTLKGESWQVAATFTTPLPRIGDISSDARYGFEFKSADNDLDFGGGTVNAIPTEIAQFFLQWVGERSDNIGRTKANVGVWVSPGGLTNRNKDTIFAASRAGAKADYAIFRGGIEQMFYLPQDVRLKFNVDGQLATNRLLASEMIYIGGKNSVRGFSENAARGDNGIVGNVTVYSPAISLVGELGGPLKGRDSLRFYGFFDAGAVQRLRPLAAGATRDSAAGGAGIGAIYQLGTNLSIDVAYGFQVFSNDIANSGSGRFHFAVVGRF